MFQALLALARRYLVGLGITVIGAIAIFAWLILWFRAG